MGTNKKVRKEKITERNQSEKELQDSEKRYRMLFTHMTDGFGLVEVIYTDDGKPSDYRYLEINPAFGQYLGVDREHMLGRTMLEVFPNVSQIALEKYHEVAVSGKSVHFEIFSEVADKYLDIYVFNPEEGKLALILRDITGWKEAETRLKETFDNLENLVKERTAELENAYNSLKESEKGLEEAQKIAHVGNWEWEILTEKSYWSDELDRIFGRSLQDPHPTYEEFLDYVHPSDLEYVENATKRAINGKTYSIDYRIIRADGEERTVHMQSEVIFDNANTPVRIKGIVQDITESKLAQQKIQENEERYRSFIENFKGIAFQADEKFIPVFMHGTVEEITGYSEEEFMSRQPWKKIIHPEDLPRIYQEEEKIRNSPHKACGEIDFRIIRRDGKIKWVHEIYQKIPGNNRTPDKYQGAIYDITERKEAEETLAKIEKIRIKEIHHRIKNNLQVISSLLDLQAETFSKLDVCKTPDVVEAFMESQTRVISMALIHEELYKGDKIDTLDFAAYMRKLTAELFSSYSPGNKDINFRLDIEQVYLGMDTAIPLGIIVNELVSNSFKHAFPARLEGEICIKLCKTVNSAFRAENPAFNTENSALKTEVSCQVKEYAGINDFHYILEVSDNGKGIPEEIDFENSNSLGLQLVNILVEQIDGFMELERCQGAKFTVWFNDVKV